MADKIQKAEVIAAQIASGLGDNLKSVLLYGTAIRGGYARTHQEVNIMVLVEDASTQAIGPIEKPLAAWVKKGNAAPLIFERSEWEGSTDVFPIEIEDMREAHRLIAGTAPAAICCWKIGTTLALLPNTLPNRTEMNRVGPSWFMD